MSANNRHSFIPEGSRYESLHATKTPRTGLKRCKKALSRLLTSLCCFIVPPFYRLVMRMVWATSKVEHNFDLIRKRDGVKFGLVAAMWLENVFMAPYLFQAFRAYIFGDCFGGIPPKLIENFRVN